MMLFLSTILSGLTYGSASLLFRFMNVTIGVPSNFYKTQRVYADAINTFYQERIAKKLSAFKRKGGVKLLIDTRFDTPGMYPV